MAIVDKQEIIECTKDLRDILLALFNKIEWLEERIISLEDKVHNKDT